jgi:hypothetical protein
VLAAKLAVNVENVAVADAVDVIPMVNTWLVTVEAVTVTPVA